MPHKSSPYGNAPSSHNHKRRAQWHDYSAPGTYMITLVAEHRRPIFGRLETRPEPHVEFYPLGEAIFREERRKINRVYPMVIPWTFCVMPDHLHMILRVVAPMPEKRHLGHVVKGFKLGCNKAARRLVDAGLDHVFEANYNDRILHEVGQLERWRKYLHDNPRRLALKQSHPDLFTVLSDYKIAGKPCQIVGNRFLLDIPDKEAVIVHRRDSDSEFQRKFNQWMACGERGGVLVGAAIAEREKLVFREAMNRGYCLIWLRQGGFPPLYKPAGEAFDACAEGRLLQLSMDRYGGRHDVVTREQCLAMNALAEDIAL